ncbi:H-NS family nucleoid-associated regulatory protein [Candidatus Sororendozoicomonas aggregata]|uniref:H-NS family histone-like protein n=1 Tax=Candidatus Sororendozoicomonas aggregata TaxID=3073239 RepID=UPI002ED54D78
MNIFEEAIDILKSKVQMRKLFQDMHVEDLQRVVSRIESIYDEKLQLQHEQQQQQSRKREAVEAVVNQMKELGLSLEDLGAISVGTSTRKHKPRERFVFSYETKDGNSVNWEGVTTGRIPAEFSEFLQRTGKDRKDCIVSELGRTET